MMSEVDLANCKGVDDGKFGIIHVFVWDSRLDSYCVVRVARHAGYMKNSPNRMRSLQNPIQDLAKQMQSNR